jgi:hypothetical protein
MAAVGDAAKELKIRYERVGNARQGQKTYWLRPDHDGPGPQAAGS